MSYDPLRRSLIIRAETMAAIAEIEEREFTEAEEHVFDALQQAIAALSQ